MSLPARHVHLDFHTSELIPGIGTRFDAKQMAKAMKLGRINHITLFAKCHHSWCYFPTRVGKTHPHLSFDLLGEQLAVCRKLKIKAPIYITVGWSANDAEWHPEWVVRKADGSIDGANFDPQAKPDAAKPTVSWKYLCIASGYRQHVLELTREICSRYKPVDGIFYDICFHERSYSAAAVEQMRAAGVNIADPAAVKTWHTAQWHSFMRECRAAIAETCPNANAFFNGRANIDTPDESLTMQTHLEMEDLPTTWGGYDKFAPRSRFFASHPLTRSKDQLAMSGKFHTSWGEFGGFKHPDAIRFEAASMIAYGAVCSFGDQLHPDGAFDLATYKNIGEAYAYVERIEEFGLGGRPHSRLGLYFSCARRPDVPAGVAGVGGSVLDHDQGVANMLMEAQLDFVAVHPGQDLSGLDTIIMSGARCLDDAEAARLNAWVKAGGKLLVIGESALDAGKKRFLFDIGAEYVGTPAFDCDYLVAGKPLAANVPAAPVLVYQPALRSTVSSGTVLATIKEPYFSRTYATYCSHQNTCNRPEDAKHPAAVQKGRILWLAHPWGANYYYHGARAHRDFFINAVRRLHPAPVVSTTLPSAGRVSIVHQPDQRRFCVHLLYAGPLQRGRTLVIEDLPTLSDIPLTLRVDEKIRSVTLPLTRKKLTAKRSAGGVSVTVPSLNCHEVVVFSY